jgi:hypothetical protein
MPFPFTLSDLAFLGCSAGLLQLLGVSLMWLTRAPASAEPAQGVVPVAPQPRATVRQRQPVVAERERSRVAA